MKQISLRLDDELHSRLTEYAKAANKNLTQYINDSFYRYGDVYRTNKNGRIQLYINHTYLGDLLIMGHISSFNGMYDIMAESIKNGGQVIIEKHFDNDFPMHMRTFEVIEDLEKWKSDITSIKL
ncbi:hypothetical protein ACWKTB_27370 [Bacillus cereus]|uniref:hypothetical protein n=1 Tax=Bacillus sp. HMA207 TaxID=2058879 RepID=UPI000E2FBEFF|nr:hypothetical protein [Bacillus sp. HMA207]